MSKNQPIGLVALVCLSLGALGACSEGFGFHKDVRTLVERGLSEITLRTWALSVGETCVSHPSPLVTNRLEVYYVNAYQIPCVTSIKSVTGAFAPGGTPTIMTLDPPLIAPRDGVVIDFTPLADSSNRAIEVVLSLSDAESGRTFNDVTINLMTEIPASTVGVSVTLEGTDYLNDGIDFSLPNISAELGQAVSFSVPSTSPLAATTCVFEWSVDGVVDPAYTCSSFSHAFDSVGAHTVSVRVELDGVIYSADCAVLVSDVVRYSVVYFANNGGVSPTPGVYAPGETVTLSIAGLTPPAGYVFHNWKADQDIGASSFVMSNATFAMPSRNVVLTAVWRPENLALSLSVAPTGSSAWVSWNELPIPPRTISVEIVPPVAGAPSVLSGSEAGFSLHGLASGVTYTVTITGYFQILDGIDESAYTTSFENSPITISN